MIKTMQRGIIVGVTSVNTMFVIQVFSDHSTFLESSAMVLNILVMTFLLDRFVQ